MKPPPDAFLSYSSKDALWVDALCKNVEAAGLRLFRDSENLAAGRSWTRQLEQALCQAPRLIVVATPAAMASEQVRRELETYQTQWGDSGERIIPVVPVTTFLPPFLEVPQQVDFRVELASDYRNRLATLLRAIDPHAPIPELGDVVIPRPARFMDERLYQRSVAMIARTCALRYQQTALAAAVGLPADYFQRWQTPELAISSILFQRDYRNPARTLAFVLEKLSDEELVDRDHPDWDQLSALRQELEAVALSGSSSPLIQQYSKIVAADHRHLLAAFGRDDVTRVLEKVFVALDLSVTQDYLPADERSLVSTDPEFDGPLSLERLIELNPDDHPWVTKRWVLRGNPGSGKTTLLRRLASRLAEGSDSKWVPLYEQIPRFVQARMSLEAYVEQESARDFPARGLAEQLDQAGRDGTLLLLLDGLDEVPRDQRLEAEDRLRRIAARWPDSTIVVTTRPIGYRPFSPADYRDINLLDLDPERKRLFLGKWFSHSSPDRCNEMADATMREITQDASLREISGCPLYLTLIAILAEDKKSPERYRHKLYDQVFDLLLAGRHRRDRKPLPKSEHARRVLQHVAFQMTELDVSVTSLDELEGMLSTREGRKVAKPLSWGTPWKKDMRAFLEIQAERCAILGPQQGTSRGWMFWHKSFKEALTAEVLHEEHQRQGDQALLRRARQLKGEEGRWAEPFALLTGHMENPDAWVLQLMEVNPLLGLRAIATAQTIRAETLLQATRLTDDQSQREDVYRRLVRDVDDPLRAISLLARLADQTRNGDELYFVHEALTFVAQTYPDERKRAKDAQTQLYDHIGAPDGRLFGNNPTHPNLPFFVDIASGVFSMGSTATDPNSTRDEKPVREVRITRPFRIAATPITVRQYHAFRSRP